MNNKSMSITILVIVAVMVFLFTGCINVYPDDAGNKEEPPAEEQPPEEPPAEEPKQQVQNTGLPIVEGECGTFLENYKKAHFQGNYIFAGDSDSGSLAKGFVSFHITTNVQGSQIHHASLKLDCKNISTDPSFFGEFIIFNAKNWGDRPLQNGDFNREDFELVRFSANGDGSVLCEGQQLIDAIQDNINSNSDRLQIIISPEPVSSSNQGRTNGKSDGFLYYVDDIELFVEYSK